MNAASFSKFCHTDGFQILGTCYIFEVHDVRAFIVRNLLHDEIWQCDRIRTLSLPTAFDDVFPARSVMSLQRVPRQSKAPGGFLLSPGDK